MTPEAIHKHLRRQPFQPFKIFLSDGAVHEVRHPEMVFVMRREVVIALPRPGEQFARMRSIAILSTLRGSSRSTAAAAKRHPSQRGSWRRGVNRHFKCSHASALQNQPGDR